MKVFTVIYSTLLAVTAVEAAVIATPTVQDLNSFCQHDSQPCEKLKRAAEAAAEAMPAPINPNPLPLPWQFQHNTCKHTGEACTKAKRDAEAVENAVLDAAKLSEIVNRLR